MKPRRLERETIFSINSADFGSAISAPVFLMVFGVSTCPERSKLNYGHAIVEVSALRAASECRARVAALVTVAAGRSDPYFCRRSSEPTLGLSNCRPTCKRAPPWGKKLRIFL